MTRETYYKKLNEDFLEAEYEFFANHTGDQLYDVIERTIATKGLCEDTSVFMEIYFGGELDFKFLHQSKFQPSEAGDRYVTFAHGEQAELARQRLAEYDKAKTDDPMPEAPDGIRIFHLSDRNYELQQLVEWNVEISVMHPYGMEDEIIAERLEVAFRNFFLPIPYEFTLISHV